MERDFLLAIFFFLISSTSNFTMMLANLTMYVLLFFLLYNFFTLKLQSLFEELLFIYFFINNINMIIYIFLLQFINKIPYSALISLTLFLICLFGPINH